MQLVAIAEDEQQFTINVQNACRLDAEILHLRVRIREIRNVLSCDALHVYDKHALIREYDLITDGLETLHGLLTGSEEICNLAAHLRQGNFFQIRVICVLGDGAGNTACSHNGTSCMFILYGTLQHLLRTGKHPEHAPRIDQKFRQLCTCETDCAEQNAQQRIERQSAPCAAVKAERARMITCQHERDHGEQ